MLICDDDNGDDDNGDNDDDGNGNGDDNDGDDNDDDKHRWKNRFCCCLVIDKTVNDVMENGCLVAPSVMLTMSKRRTAAMTRL